jgi:hypothetical protein
MNKSRKAGSRQDTKSEEGQKKGVEITHMAGALGSGEGLGESEGILKSWQEAWGAWSSD